MLFINFTCFILKGEFDVNEIYRALALTTAHLHLMISNDSFADLMLPTRRQCKTMMVENPLQQQIVRM